MRSLICTAEPFGYGPSSSLAQIVSRMATLAPRGDRPAFARASYLGAGHTLDFAHAIAAYGQRVEACASDDAAAFAGHVREADGVLVVTDFAAAAAARDAGRPFALYDPLAWYWREIPAVCRDAAIYVCQDFFGVRARVAAAGLPNAVVVPPLTPEIEPVPLAERDGILVSLGGLGNPYFTAAKCADYARAVLTALRRAVADEPGPITSLTSAQIAQLIASSGTAPAAAIPGMEIATLAPAEVHQRIARARVCFLTPGLGQLYEASALRARAVWLPPANDSQGRQLREVVARGMTLGAVDWHEFMDVPRVDYAGEQAHVMQTLAAHMERLLHDSRAQARLAAVVRARMIAVRDAGDDPLAQLVTEHGEQGATVTARIVDAWVRSLDERRGPARRLGTVDPPSGFAPLVVPRENRAGGEVIEAVRTLHAEVNGTGLHTLTGVLEVMAATRARSQRPDAHDFRAALAAWRASGLAVWAKYRAGNCTALAEVLRAKIQRAVGLTGEILCVRYADSKRPLAHTWDYEGTVHADLLVPFLDGERVRALHLVCGNGVTGHCHVFDDEARLLAHLDELAYTRGAAIDPAELTRAAFQTKDRWWIVEGPDITDDSYRLGVDVIEGTVFLNRSASARHRGLRPAAGEQVSVPLAWALEGGQRALVDRAGRSELLPSADALRAVLDAMRGDFRQPDDFTDNLMFLAQHLDAWCEATLAEPGRSLRRARRRERDTLESPSAVVVDLLHAVDASAGLAPARVAEELIGATCEPVAARRLVDQLRALRALPRSSSRARLALAAEAVRLRDAARAAPPAPPPGPDDDPAPSVLDPPPPAAADDTIQGVRFDPTRQIYVPGGCRRW